MATFKDGDERMKATFVLGSPRITGNSTAIADHLLIRLKDRGMDVRRFHLNTMRYRGCQGCMRCKTADSVCCGIQDDLTPALARAADTDLLVLASPVYFGDVSAQMKGFIDRTYSFFQPGFQMAENPSRLVPGKQLMFILTQGSPDEAVHAELPARYERFFAGHGFVGMPAIRCCGISPEEDVTQRRVLFRNLDMLAERLCA